MKLYKKKLNFKLNMEVFMKKRHIIFGIGILTLVFCASACSKKSDNSGDNNQKIEKKEDVKADNSEMIIPGYSLGEIPPIQIPEVPNLSVTENPEAKITLDKAKKISSVPGITVTPVKVENDSIVGGNYAMQIGKDGAGQYSDNNKVVQTDGNGTGQYSDEKVTIQRDEDGSGQYINNITGVILQVDSDGGGQYTDDKNNISFQVDADGTGMYINESTGTTINVRENDATYNSGDISIENNGDGSGYYNDRSRDLVIENDGKGKAIITYKGKTLEVDAKPLAKPGKFSKLQMVPPIPSIEANSILITFDAGVLFDVDKYNIRPDAEGILKNLVTVLKEADIKSFEIDGHTDSDASDEHNQVLSENRANSVKNFLVSQGVTAQISTKGYGEKRPIATNDTPEGKQKNRRVEIIIPTI